VRSTSYFYIAGQSRMPGLLLLQEQASPGMTWWQADGASTGLTGTATARALKESATGA